MIQSASRLLSISSAIPSEDDPQDIDCNQPEVDRGEYSESATNAVCMTLIPSSLIYFFS
jgi:hypothetical protein